MALNDPPYEFAPEDPPWLTAVSALQLEHGASLTLTFTALTIVAAHVLLLAAELLQLQAYAPI